MKSKAILFLGVLKKNLIEMKRYFFNTLSGLVTVYLLFLLLFFGGKTFIATPDFGSTLDGLVVGFFLWTFTMDIYSVLSRSLIKEAKWGTLEQIYMSSQGFGWFAFSQLVSDFFITIVINVGFLYAMMATTGRFLQLRVASTLPLIVITLISIVGIGYFLGGLGLVFKRVEASFQIFQFVFAALVMIPIESFPLLKFFPLAFGADLIRKVMIDGTPITHIPLEDLGFLVVNSGGYFLIGFVSFKYFEKVAKRKGLLGHY